MRTFPFDLALSQTGHEASLFDAVDAAAAGPPNALLDLDLFCRRASLPSKGEYDRRRAGQDAAQSLRIRVVESIRKRLEDGDA